MYHFVDSSAVVVGNSGKFGLNQNALLKCSNLNLMEVKRVHH